MLSSPTILVCTDFSKNSDQALQAAELLRARTHGNILLLHVVELGPFIEWSEGMTAHPVLMDKEFMEELYKDVMSKMQQQIDRCRAKAEPILKNSPSVIPAILDVVAERKADLLVIGGHGQGNLGHNTFGSITRKTIGALDIPALVIKRDFKAGKVAALVDASETMKGVISWAEEMVHLNPSELTVISLWQDLPGIYGQNYLEHASSVFTGFQEQAPRCLAKIREKIGLELGRNKDARIVVEPSREKKIAYHLVEILQDGNFDLAVMKRHNRSAFEKFFIGSETSRVLELYEGNLLICPPTKE